MFKKLYSIYNVGIDNFLLEIEIATNKGLPSINVVGLPDNVIKESKERVISAIKNSGFNMPLMKIVINLSPADKKKSGSHLDLPIALSILYATNQLKNIPNNAVFASELSLSGKLKPSKKIVSMGIFTEKNNMKLFTSKDNLEFLENINGNFYLFDNLKELVDSFNKKEYEKNKYYINNNYKENNFFINDNIFNDVIGQEIAKRATIIAVSGFHSIIFFGTPGSGKSMICNKIKYLMPKLNGNRLTEKINIYSISNSFIDKKTLYDAPFRQIHQTISQIGLIGGINSVGEITLSHNGVLFLDELSEFSRIKIESLRQPLTDKFISISRKDKKVIYPCNFMFVATSNLCPCGNYGDSEKVCICSDSQRKRYISKISKAILDRIDIQIKMTRVNLENINKNSIKKIDYNKLIKNAIYMQKNRFKNLSINFNSEMSNDLIEKYCKISNDLRSYMNNICEKFKINLRGYFNILKVARTIADLELRELIEKKDINESINLRYVDFNRDIFY